MLQDSSFRLAFNHSVSRRAVESAVSSLYQIPSLVSERLADPAAKDPDKLQLVEEYRSRFLFTPQGQRYTAHEFLLSYIVQHNRVVEHAKFLIDKDRSLDELRSNRARLTQPTSVLKFFASSAARDSVKAIDASIQENILNWTADSKEIEVIAYDLAILTLERSRRNIGAATWLKANQDIVNLRRKRMAEALGNNSAHPLSTGENPAESFLLHFLDIVYRETGQIPPLVVLHDVDFNLTADEGHYNEQKPSFGIDLLLENLLAKFDENVPVSQRVPLIHPLRDNLPGYESLRELYFQAGKAVSPALFDDVKVLFQQDPTHNGEIGHYILSANLAELVHGVAHSLGHDPRKIFGTRVDSVNSLDKPLTITQFFANDPNSIIVMSDDGDRSIVHSLMSGKVNQLSEIDVAVSDLCFFCARLKGQRDRGEFRLAPTLRAKNIPFFENIMDSQGHRTKGYQGTTQAIDAYTRWRLNL